MKIPRVALLAAAMLFVVASCESQNTAKTTSESRVIAARDKLVADLQQCTRTNSYDPKAAGLPENALAPNELKWRQCAYDAVCNYELAHPSVRGMYDQLIAEDIQMTTGNITRSQRRTRIEQLVGQIKAAEDAEVRAAEVEQARQQEQLRNVVDSARGFGS
jgi:hypothetical protein